MPSIRWTSRISNRRLWSRKSWTSNRPFAIRNSHWPENWSMERYWPIWQRTNGESANQSVSAESYHIMMESANIDSPHPTYRIYDINTQCWCCMEYVCYSVLSADNRLPTLARPTKTIRPICIYILCRFL